MLSNLASQSASTANLTRTQKEESRQNLQARLQFGVKKKIIAHYMVLRTDQSSNSIEIKKAKYKEKLKGGEKKINGTYLFNGVVGASRIHHLADCNSFRKEHKW